MSNGVETYVQTNKNQENFVNLKFHFICYQFRFQKGPLCGITWLLNSIEVKVQLQCAVVDWLKFHKISQITLDQIQNGYSV